MNWKRLWLAVLVVFILSWILNFIINSVILSGYYSRPDIVAAFRPEDQMMKYMWVMAITGAVFSFFFVFIFAKGYEAKGIAEGFRYGIYIAVFYYYVTSFNEFVVYPIPYGLAWIWFLSGLVVSVILGIAAAAIYKPRVSPAATAAG
jgi:ABC-type multidrug transport system permease subunit